MRKKSRLVLAAAIALLGALLLLMKFKVDPLTEDLALARVCDLASNVINEAVSEEIGSVRYSDLVTLERDSSGGISALTTNMQEMNRLKTDLLRLLDEKLHEISEDEISLPMGNVTGLQFLSGRGPKLPVKIMAVASSDAVFEGTFSNAGINQTLHQIMLEVAVDLVVLLPTGTVTEHVSTDVCVAETVLLGPVPDSYTYFNSVGSAADIKYFTNEG